MTKEAQLADYVLNLSIAEVVHQLGDRGLSPSGEPEVLRARLTQAVFQEAGLQPIPVELVSDFSSQGAGATSELPDTVKLASEVGTMLTVDEEGRTSPRGAWPRISNDANRRSRSAGRDQSIGVQGSQHRGGESSGSGRSEVNEEGKVNRLLSRSRAFSHEPQEFDNSPPPYEAVRPRATSSFINGHNQRHVSFLGDANYNLRPNEDTRLSSVNSQRIPNFENLGGFSAREGFGSLNPISKIYSRRYENHDRSQDFRPVNNFNVNPRIPQANYVWPQIPPI